MGVGTLRRSKSRAEHGTTVFSRPGRSPTFSWAVGLVAPLGCQLPHRTRQARARAPAFRSVWGRARAGDCAARRRRRPVIAVERDRAWRRRYETASSMTSACRSSKPTCSACRYPANRSPSWSNLPYSVAAKAVRRLLVDGHGLRAAVLVLQLEAARRIAGVAPSVNAGALRISARRPTSSPLPLPPTTSQSSTRLPDRPRADSGPVSASGSKCPEFGGGAVW